MTEKEVFQKQHGANWHRTTHSGAWAAAMALVNASKIEAIANLTDTEIDTYGKIILADLRGFLQHEIGLIELQEIKNMNFGDVGEPTYPPPEDEALEAEQAEKRTRRKRKSGD